jgi:hypothetical protein
MGILSLLSSFCLVAIGVILATSSPAYALKMLLCIIAGVLMFLLAVSFGCWFKEVK